MAEDDDGVPVYVVLMVMCDRCESLLTVEASTYPAAQEKLHAEAGAQGWYVAERVRGANGTASKHVQRVQLTRDLCPSCYQKWTG